MSSVLGELCRNLQSNTEKLEEELKRNIMECHKLLIDHKATETTLTLEKAKDYHYKEVIEILKDIVISIRKIIHHEEKIRKLNNENNLTPDELKRYSYVQRQVKAFSRPDEVITKREKRRVASAVSIESLEAWQLYLEKKDEEEKVLQVEQTVIPKRKTPSKRRKKKFVSSTFNNFLDGRTDTGKLDSILEDDSNSSVTDRLSTQSEYTEEYDFEMVDKNDFLHRCGRSLEDIPTTALKSIYESKTDDKRFINRVAEDENSEKQNLSTLYILQSLNDEYFKEEENEDTKPKIVEVIYKKRTTEEPLEEY